MLFLNDRRLLALILVVAAAALGSAPPARAGNVEGQPIDPESCRTRLLREIGRVPDYRRDIYRSFVQEICVSADPTKGTGEPTRNPEWQRCIYFRLTGEVPPGGMAGAPLESRIVPDNIHHAWNECYPPSRTCRQEMNASATAAGATAAARRYMLSHCGGDQSYSPEYRECLARRARDPFFRRSDALISTYCSDSTRGCVEEMLGTLIRPPTEKTHKIIGRVCGGSTPPQQERDCVLSYINGNPPLAEYATELCKPERAQRRACLDEQLESRRFRAAASGRIRDEIEYSDVLCSIPTQAGKDCVLALLQGTFGVHAARYVCQFRSADTRACLTSFLKGEAPYDPRALDKHREDLLFDLRNIGEIERVSRRRPFAQRVCSYSNVKDRECFVRGFLFFLESTGDDRGALEGARMACSGSAERRKCVDDLLAIPEFAMVNSVIRHTHISVNEICDIPTFEIRDCVVRALPEMLRTRGTFNSVMSACQAAFITNLLGPDERFGRDSCAFDRTIGSSQP